jgi:hypothetical protein
VSVWRTWERREIREGCCWENLNEREHHVELGIDGNMILKIKLKEIGWEGVDWIYVPQGVEGFCGHVNEPSGSMKCWAFLVSS